MLPVFTDNLAFWEDPIEVATGTSAPEVILPLESKQAPVWIAGLHIGMRPITSIIAPSDIMMRPDDPEVDKDTFKAFVTAIVRAVGARSVGDIERSGRFSWLLRAEQRILDKWAYYTCRELAQRPFHPSHSWVVYHLIFHKFLKQTRKNMDYIFITLLNTPWSIDTELAHLREINEMRRKLKYSQIVVTPYLDELITKAEIAKERFYRTTVDLTNDIEIEWEHFKFYSSIDDPLDEQIFRECGASKVVPGVRLALDAHNIIEKYTSNVTMQFPGMAGRERFEKDGMASEFFAQLNQVRDAMDEQMGRGRVVAFLDIKGKVNSIAEIAVLFVSKRKVVGRFHQFVRSREPVIRVEDQSYCEPETRGCMEEHGIPKPFLQAHGVGVELAFKKLVLALESFYTSLIIYNGSIDFRIFEALKLRQTSMDLVWPNGAWKICMVAYSMMNQSICCAQLSQKPTPSGIGNGCIPFAHYGGVPTGSEKWRQDYGNTCALNTCCAMYLLMIDMKINGLMEPGLMRLHLGMEIDLISCKRRGLPDRSKKENYKLPLTWRYFNDTRELQLGDYNQEAFHRAMDNFKCHYEYTQGYEEELEEPEYRDMKAYETDKVQDILRGVTNKLLEWRQHWINSKLRLDDYFAQEHEEDKKLEREHRAKRQESDLAWAEGP